GLFPGGIIVIGGEPGAGSDTVNFTGTGNAVTVDLATLTVSEVGGSTVTLNGIETLNVNAGAGNIFINGRGSAETFNVTPTAADTATITATGVTLTVNTNNTGRLRFIGFGGNDTVL